MTTANRRGLQSSKRGQSTLEYILVLAAVLLALIAAATQFVKPSADRTLSQSQQVIQNSANRIRTGLRGL